MARSTRPFSLPARHRDRPRLVAIVSREGEQCRVEADGIALTFQHGALEIVVEQDTRTSIEGLERRDMTTQEALHARIEEEAQEYLARPAQHHDESHQTADARDRS